MFNKLQHSIFQVEKNLDVEKREAILTLFFFPTPGKGPKTFFHVGKILPINMRNGQQISYDDTCMIDGTNLNCDVGIPQVGLKGLPKRDFIITLPGDLKSTDISWLSLYCRRFKINFADIMLNTTTGDLFLF